MASSPQSAITTITTIVESEADERDTVRPIAATATVPSHHNHAHDHPPSSTTQHNTSVQQQQQHANTAHPQHQMYVISPNFFQPMTLPVLRTIADFALIIFAWVGLEYLLRYYGPFERGFYCDDQSIRYPFKPNTISAKQLFVYTFVMPAVAVIIVELMRLSNSRTSDEYFSKYEYGRSVSGRFLVRFTTFYGYSALAFSATALLTTVAKFSVGRMRPFFLAVCRPKHLNLDTCEGLHNRYITDFECDWTNPRLASESRLSFFSGHSSFSMCSAVFVVLYLQSRARVLVQPHVSRVPLALAQVGIVASACFIAYSRIFDYWHHWSDVLCGMVVGTLVATITALFIGQFEMKLSAATPAKCIKTVSSSGAGNDVPSAPQLSAITRSSRTPSL